MSPLRIALTGSAGLIGSATAKIAQDRGVADDGSHGYMDLTIAANETASYKTILVDAGYLAVRAATGPYQFAQGKSVASGSFKDKTAEDARNRSNERLGDFAAVLQSHGHRLPASQTKLTVSDRYNNP